jgi:KipI family sensor histidine kinase inhibitor
VTDPFRIVPAGDAALIVEFADRIDPVINAAAVALARSLQAKSIAGVRDTLPTFRSVAVHFDPLRTDYAALVEELRDEATRALAAATDIDAAPPIRVPVCYGGELGPDLPAVARFAGVTEPEAIDIHASRTYRVFMLGFVPGFTYLGTVDPRIAVPRMTTPRLRVPPGSVGIAGPQTGIYPASTPGGWQIVGTTPVRPFDIDRTEPFLFKPGDAVQFYAIDAAEYRLLQKSA